MKPLRHAFVGFALVLLTACAHRVAMQAPSGQTIDVPRDLASSLDVVRSDDKDYGAADPLGATGAPGAGKVTRPLVVRLKHDLAVYRVWDGPRGRTARIGQWWTFDRPSGTLASYRRRYEVCEEWNSLRWVAACTLRGGSVVVIGPGQSVSAETCGDRTGRENYSANERDLQVYVHEAWKHTDPPDGSLQCPAEGRDYQNDPEDIARPAKGTNTTAPRP